MFKNLKIGVGGFLMAAADSVPGVSGGTIAFVLGFYETFIDSLNALMGHRFGERRQALIWLGKLGLGWVLGMGIFSSIITRVLESSPYTVFSLFLGFTVFAIPLVVKEEWKSINGHWGYALFIPLGALLVYGVTWIGPGAVVNLDHIDVLMALYLFVAAAVAICAMVLPGISGSTLLLIMGVYTPIITAVRNLFHLDFSALPILIIFGIGVLVGLGTTVKLVAASMKHHRLAMVFFIIGLMIGSLFAIVQGPTALALPRAALSMGTFSGVWFLIGGAILGVLSAARYWMESQDTARSQA